MIANGEFVNIFANTLDNAAAFMAQDGWEKAFGIDAAQCVRIGVADTSCQHLDANLVRFRWANFDFFN